MNEQWALSIEDKVLLAEKVMGWSNRKPHHRTKEGETCFWVDKDFPDNILFMSGDYGDGVYTWWPEANKGHAAELMLALPQVELFKFSDGKIKAHCTWLNAVQSRDFCETICRLALAHTRED